MLSVESLVKSYGANPVLRGVSMSVAQGEILGLAGPNGAGKTTLLKCIVGVVRSDAGHIQVGDRNALVQQLEARRLIGYAPSETALYHRLRAGELLDFATRYHPERDLTRGLDLLGMLGVPLRRRIGALSHGMKRKVLLAQALASGAPMLILDEPMEAFDPAARRIAVELLRASAASGAAILTASHDLASTEVLCDRLAFLSNGKVIREGPTREIVAEASRVIHLTLRTHATAETLPTATGWVWHGSGLDWTLVHDGPLEATLAQLASLPIASIRAGDCSLDEVFGSLYEGNQS